MKRLFFKRLPNKISRILWNSQTFIMREGILESFSLFPLEKAVE